MKKKALRTTQPAQIISYKSKMNELRFFNFTPMDQNIFWSIIKMVQDKGTDIVDIDFKLIKDLAGYNVHNTNKSFDELLDDVTDKLGAINLKQIFENNSWEKIPFFSKFSANKNTKTLTVRVSDEAATLINNTNEGKALFTLIELQQFVFLDGKYAKGLYLSLMQFRRSGWARYDINDLRNRLDVPDDATTGYFIQKCLEPAVKQLSEVEFNGKKIFEGLKFDRIKVNGHGNGGKIAAIKFTFKRSLSYLGETDEKKKKRDALPSASPKQKQIEKPANTAKVKAKSNHGFEEHNYDFSAVELAKRKHISADEASRLLVEKKTQQALLNQQMAELKGR